MPQQTVAKELERSNGLCGGLEAVTDGLSAVGVGPDDVGSEANLHAQADVGWVRRRIDDVAADTGSIAINHSCGERHGNAGGGEGHDGKGTNGTFGVDVNLGEIGSETPGAGVSAIEVTSFTGGAFIGHQVRTVT